MFTAPRGTQDILPAEQKYWRYVIGTAEKIAGRYGFVRIDTPVFEETDLFHRSVGEGTDIVEKETYDFVDKSGGCLTLRPEGTASVCRAYIEHGLFNEPKPLKLYYLAPAFRYDRPQKGRYRQHHQFGGEVLGDSSALCDAETIAMLWRFYQDLGLQKLVLHINSIGCQQCRPAYLQALKDFYDQNLDGLCADCRRRFEKNTLRLLDCKEVKCSVLALMAPKNTDYLCGDCAEHHKQLKEFLSALQITFNENHRLVRGLDYYNRTVFEVSPADTGSQQSALGGGGRYDNLVGRLGGPITPALGFGTGLERIIINLKEQGVDIAEIYRTDIFVATMGAVAQIQALKITEELRTSGYHVLLGATEKSLKAQMKQAGKSQAALAVIIGEEEAANGNVLIKPLQNTGEQQTVSQTTLVQTLDKFFK